MSDLRDFLENFCYFVLSSYLRGCRGEQNRVRRRVSGVDHGWCQGSRVRRRQGPEEDWQLEGEAGINEGRSLGSVVDEERLEGFTVIVKNRETFVQGDHSDSSQPLVDMKTKDAF